ncbi:MAG: hypothetical protein KGO02_13540 [Alphaproteobacteria bacterium]|nr:hypothetical protein [Alphaproteobacteria bacterium]
MWQLLNPFLPTLFMLAVLLWWQRRSKGSRLRPWAMWVIPCVTAFALYTTLRHRPPELSLLTLLGFPLALAAGVVVGWLRARHLHIRIDGVSGRVTTRATAFGLILLAALFLLRAVLRSIFVTPAGHGHLAGTALLSTDLGLVFSVGLIWARAITLTLRVRPLLAAHRAGSGS